MLLKKMRLITLEVSSIVILVTQPLRESSLTHKSLVTEQTLSDIEFYCGCFSRDVFLLRCCIAMIVFVKKQILHLCSVTIYSVMTLKGT